MLLGGWELDLARLYGDDWIRRSPHWREELVESPSGGTAIVAYRIDEVGVMKFGGRIAVVRNKPSPEVIFNPKAIFHWSGPSGVEFDATGQFATVYEFRTLRGPRKRTIDLVLGRYARSL